MIYRALIRIALFALWLVLEQNLGPSVNSFWMILRIAAPTFLAAPLPQVDNLGFQVGERLTYRISWSNFMQAGTAELTVSPGSSTTANSYRLQLKAISTP